MKTLKNKSKWTNGEWETYELGKKAGSKATAKEINNYIESELRTLERRYIIVPLNVEVFIDDVRAGLKKFLGAEK